MAPRRPADDVADGPDADPEGVARSICLRLLTVRARTRSELADALLKRNVPSSAATTVLDRLTEVGLVDDAAFAEQFVTTRQAERGLAVRELRRQLADKGVSSDVVQTVTSKIDPAMERRTAERLVERKLRTLRGLEPAVQTRRLVSMLARKGYSPGMSYAVVRGMVVSVPEDEREGDLYDTGCDLA